MEADPTKELVVLADDPEAFRKTLEDALGALDKTGKYLSRLQRVVVSGQFDLADALVVSV